MDMFSRMYVVPGIPAIVISRGNMLLVLEDRLSTLWRLSFQKGTQEVTTAVYLTQSS